MSSGQTIKVFVAAPSDVDVERLEVHRAIARLNQKLDDVNFEVYQTHDLIYQSDESFQSQISQDNIDLVVTILWYKIGTVLSEEFNRVDGSSRTGTMFEYENALETRKLTGAPDVLAYRKMADISPEYLDQLSALEAFWRRHFYDGETYSGAFKTFKTTGDFAALIEREIETWYRKKYLLHTWYLGSPFRGLEAFEPEHKTIFFGRDEAIKQLATKITAKETKINGINNFTLVLGASGSGKSSLVRAGVIPTLIEQGTITHYLVTTPSILQAKPILGLANALFKTLPNLVDGDLPTSELLAANSSMFVHAINGAIKRLEVDDGRLLIFLDQFEELFTWVDDKRQKLIELLSMLAGCESLYLIVSLRADFYNRWLDNDLLFSLSDSNRRFELQPIRAHQLKVIIEQPAKSAGLTFEQNSAGLSLADVLLNDAEGGRKVESNCLPLLQFTLDKLYLAKRDNVLTFAAYRELGGITRAISRTAEELLNRLHFGEQTFNRVIAALVEIDEDGHKSRKSAPIADFEAEPLKLVNELINARLIVADKNSEQEYVRLTHDKLLEHWQSLNDWYQNSLDFRRWLARVVKSTKLWQQNNYSKDYLLLADKLLLEAKSYSKSHGIELENAVDKDIDVSGFIKASSINNRNKSWLRIGFIVGVYILLNVAVVYSNKQQEIAQQQKLEAEKGRKVALEQQKIAKNQQRLAELQERKSEQLLEQVRDTLKFMNSNLREVLQKYTPIHVRVEITEQVDALLSELRKHAPTDDISIYDQAVALQQKADMVLQSSDGNPVQALSRYRESHTIFLAMIERFPNVPFYQQVLAISFNRLGDNHLRLGQFEEGLNAYQEGLAIRHKLVLQDETNILIQRDLSISYDKLGSTYLRVSQNEKALQAYGKSLAIRQKLIEHDSTNISFLRDMSVSYSRVGDVYLLIGLTNKALSSYQEAMKIDRKLSLQDESNIQFQHDLSISYNDLGNIYLRLNQTNKALEAYQSGLQIIEKLAIQDKTNIQFQRDLAVFNARLGDVYLRIAQFDKVLLAYGTNLSILKELNVEVKTDALIQRDFSIAYNKLGDVYLRLGQIPEALEHYQAGLEIRQNLKKQEDMNSQYEHDLSVSHSKIGDAYLRFGLADKALSAYKTSLRILKALNYQDNTNIVYQRDLLISYQRLGSFYSHLEQATDALPLFEQALELAEKLHLNAPHSTQFQRDLAVAYWKMYKIHAEFKDRTNMLFFLENVEDVLRAIKEKGGTRDGDEQWLQDIQQIVGSLKVG